MGNEKQADQKKGGGFGSRPRIPRARYFSGGLEEPEPLNAMYLKNSGGWIVIGEYGIRWESTGLDGWQLFSGVKTEPTAPEVYLESFSLLREALAKARTLARRDAKDIMSRNY